MKNEIGWMKIKQLRENTKIDLLLSLSVSFFGLILIFGLGFVFPEINPYSAIKWIVIVCAVVFAYSLISFIVMSFKISKKMIEMESGEVVLAKKTSKSRKSSRK